MHGAIDDIGSGRTNPCFGLQLKRPNVWWFCRAAHSYGILDTIIASFADGLEAGNVHHLPPSPHLQTVTTTPDDSQAYTSHAVLESIILLCFMYGCIAYPLQTIHYIEYIALSLGRQEIPKYACRYIYVHNGVRVVVGLLTPYWLPLYNLKKKKTQACQFT